MRTLLAVAIGFATFFAIADVSNAQILRRLFGCNKGCAAPVQTCPSSCVTTPSCVATPQYQSCQPSYQSCQPSYQCPQVQSCQPTYQTYQPQPTVVYSTPSCGCSSPVINASPAASFSVQSSCSPYASRQGVRNAAWDACNMHCVSNCSQATVARCLLYCACQHAPPEIRPACPLVIPICAQ